MSLIATVIDAAERAPVPDVLTRAGIDFLVGRTRRRLDQTSVELEEAFLRGMTDFPVAAHTDAANAQHYEVPSDFFGLTLGPRRKYSCCLYPAGTETLAAAEEAALAETVAHAGLADGQTILELGCGWGSLTLYMAQKYPRATILAVSNSTSQRRHIEGEAAQRGLGNVRIVTADMNDFQPDGHFDRIVSVEMFEHMSNWRELLGRVRGWLAPEGRLFLHVFTHKSRSYRFDHRDEADWIARHFFTGGIMPSHDLPHRFPDLFTVEDEWRWSGTHYARTARDWLANMDARAAEVDPVLASVYGTDANLWKRRWRLFFLATEGLFGHAGGDVWGVGHYLLRPAAR
ncbi:SAM-dependent methyltransferase [Methylobrevis pamukkalensis]|uniref:Cyclopropane-fatty-acyl-phospholipid synthase n=1 Tax=Methylobrevis pamukkalensis TaxID=1439726 RepID=A0A1E3H8Y1_9HYPH|nr:cyclopropane-fatty-acyl-phospholipid synthase family protein [Methylobrevis pamukkalensis]ODN71951.1 Cyclopropane-fatty-acyl-phospholipid synthase [Methylobrevis pamukkalensis]